MINLSIKKILEQKEIVVGLTVLHVCQPWIAKIFADAGADFLYVEYEHMFFNEADLGSLILSSRLCGMPVVAKSSYLDRGSVAKLLEAGVTGIQLPMTENVGQISSFARYAKFPPHGIRAAAPGTGNTDYLAVDCSEWIKKSNDDITIIAHIENCEGVANIDDILSEPQVDIMFIGLLDLSVNLGHPAEFNHPDIVKTVERLVASAKEYKKVAGMYAPGYDVARQWIDKGVRFFECASEVGFISEKARQLIGSFPGHGAQPEEGSRH